MIGIADGLADQFIKCPQGETLLIFIYQGYILWPITISFGLWSLESKP